MLFTGPVFLFLFLPVVLCGYYIFPTRFRNIWLIVASLFFYAWGEWSAIWVLLAMMLINYLLGIIIGKYHSRWWLAIAVLVNLGYIFYFKYLIFALTIVLGKSSTIIPQIVMPLGVSFVTFHLISYVIDIYRGEIKAEKNIFNFGLYILMFPHLIAGPIVRYKDIGEQIIKRTVSAELFAEGIKRFIGGLAKKVLIANIMAAVADQIFATFPQYLTGQMVWLGLISYSLQIYFDFSGYSDMAIGLAKMFGFNFKENFNYPYIADSIQDFWRRWHISLSSWFRDYLYIPLGGDRKGSLRTLINIGIVFALTGLWHGANWHFVFWGMYFGVFLIAERLFLAKVLSRLGSVFRHTYVLLVVIIGWLFFRVESLSYSIYLLKVMLGSNPNGFTVYKLSYFVTAEYLAILLLAIVLATPFGKYSYTKLVTKFPRFDLIFFGGIMILSIMQLAGETYNPFIYFRF